MALRPSGADVAMGGAGLQSGDGGGGGKGAASVRAAPDMSEAQQLAAAIRASMTSDVQSDSDDSVVIVPQPDMEVEEKEEEVEEEEDMPPTFEEEIISIVVGEEPIGTDGVARVMIRMPDGKRLIRKFLLSDTVTIIYAFIAQCNDDA